MHVYNEEESIQTALTLYDKGERWQAIAKFVKGLIKAGLIKSKDQSDAEIMLSRATVYGVRRIFESALRQAARNDLDILY